MRNWGGAEDELLLFDVIYQVCNGSSRIQEILGARAFLRVVGILEIGRPCNSPKAVEVHSALYSGKSPTKFSSALRTRASSRRDDRS